MIVGASFADDSTAIGWILHDVYGDALMVIRQECREITLIAAAVLGVTPPQGAKTIKPIDHRTLQVAHDIIAAAWRYRANAAQVSLAFDGQKADIATDWLNWLRSEVRSWQTNPELIRLILGVVENQNNTRGYAAEDALTVMLFRRYADVPWLPAKIELLAKLETDAAADR